MGHDVRTLDCQKAALDAIDWFEPDKDVKAHKSEVAEFMKAAQGAQIENHPSVGLGTDLRLESKKVIGFSLLVRDKITHLCIFARTNSRDHRRQPSRMARFSQRMRNIVY